MTNLTGSPTHSDSTVKSQDVRSESVLLLLQSGRVVCSTVA